MINSDYRLSFPYTIEPKLRRGELIIERDAYRLGEFDGPTESSAFWIRGWEGLKSHWIKLERGKGHERPHRGRRSRLQFLPLEQLQRFLPEVLHPSTLKAGRACVIAAAIHLK
ncbi:MAG: hypothetical protein V8S87_10355 [Oscillospiraceae bacterium]